MYNFYILFIWWFAAMVRLFPEFFGKHEIWEVYPPALLAMILVKLYEINNKFPVRTRT